MRILHVHEHYRQMGGEEISFANEDALLEREGHSLVRYTLHNDRLAAMNRVKAGVATVWNHKVYRELRDLIRRASPEVAYFQNTFPLVSPSSYYAARAEGVPVVQMLRNYRLLCPNGLFFRDGRPCEDCMGRVVAWPGVVHACYRGSVPATGAVAAMLAVHRLLGTWARAVDVYVALTEFARSKFVAGGLPAEKIVVKPNFVYPDPGVGEGHGRYALFVGRLSAEKGVETLLAAWRLLDGRPRLKIVGGTGPLAARLPERAATVPGVECLGQRAETEVYALMGDAAFVVVPSEWYEPFGRVVIEAFAKGTPVIASRMGAIEELVEDGKNGLLFEPGSAESLAGTVQWALAHEHELTRMRKAARAEFESKFTAERNHRLMLGICERAAARAQVWS